MKQRIDFLNSELERISKNLAQILPVLDAFKPKIAKGVKMTPDTIKNIKDMSEAASTLMKQREEYAEELQDASCNYEKMENGMHVPFSFFLEKC